MIDPTKDQPPPLLELNGGLVLKREDFEAEYLGGPAFSLLGIDDAPVVTVERAISELRVKLETWPGWTLVTARTAGGAAGSVLEACSFRQVEVSITLERPLDGADSVALETDTDFAMPKDRESCINIAREAFVFDRFRSDPVLSDTAAGALKSAWLANSLDGRADRAFVARRDARAVAFNMCMVRGDVAWIDLIAVAPKARRAGIARALVEAAIAHYAARGFLLLCVKTQESNVDSLALYEACGFRKSKKTRVFHLTSGAPL